MDDYSDIKRKIRRIAGTGEMMNGSIIFRPQPVFNAVVGYRLNIICKLFKPENYPG
jgi:hypothetical protein